MSEPSSLFDKVWESHTVGRLRNGQDQLFIDTHLIHEVTSPQAFGMLADLGLEVLLPERTFATVDHIVPTHTRVEPFADPMAAAMIAELRKNTAAHGITFFDVGGGKQGPRAPTGRSAPSRSASARRRCATCSPRRRWP